MVKEYERVDDLIWRGLKIIQNPRWFCFSLDAVLLAHFATVRAGDNIVDLGTGTGVIPLLLWARVPNTNTIGLEIIPEVADMARRSVEINNLSNQMTILQGNIKEASTLLGRGDKTLVTCNPPYARVETGKTSTCSIKSAARSETLCSLEDVVREGAALLNSQGRLALVHRPQRLTDILFLMRRYQIEPKRLRFVSPLPGKEPNMVLVEGIKQGKNDLLIHPQLYIYQDREIYSPEMTKIFSGEFLPGTNGR